MLSLRRLAIRLQTLIGLGRSICARRQSRLRKPAMERGAVSKVQEALSELMETARTRALHIAETNKLPLTFPNVYPVAHASGEGVSGSWETRIENAMRGWVGRPLRNCLGDDGKEAVLRIATQMLSSCPETLPFWAPYTLASELVEWPSETCPTFDAAPREWVARNVILPVTQAYLQALDSLQNPSVGLRDRLIEEAVALAGARCLRTHTMLFVAGLRTALERMEIKGVSVRRLSPRELGAQLYGLRVVLLGPETIPPVGLSTLTTHAIEVVDEGPRNSQPEDTGRWRAILLALQLDGLSLAGPTVATFRYLPTWRFTLTQFATASLRDRGAGQRDLDESQLATAVELAERVNGKTLENPSQPSELALHRFAVGAGRDSSTDAVLDFVIALEALLLPYDAETRHGDLSYRFRAHGAHYLSEQPEDRGSTWARLNELYDIRSRLVHGSKYPSAGDINAAAESARKLAARGLLRAIREGFPTPSLFRKLVLGET